MTRKKKLLIGAGVVLVGALLLVANFRFQRTTGKSVNVEAIKARNLESTVSASGKIEAERTVNISSDVPGRVTALAVEEGAQVKRDQFLMQIDPRNLRSRLESNEAGLGASQSELQQQRIRVTQARETLNLARLTLQRQKDLWAQQLTTKEALDKAENDVKVNEAELNAADQSLGTQEMRIRQQRAEVADAQFNLSRVRIESPIDGIVTRRNIEEGETVVVGTMNNPGTQLLTIADMSVIEAQVEVDETDIPTVKLGQIAKITIDAIPGKTFTGKVTEIGNSPIQSASPAAAGQQATNFKVTVTIDGQIPEVRPGFTCSAEITTATRENMLSVPIQAMAVRELIYDKDGNIVRPKEDETKKRRPGTSGGSVAAASGDLPAGQTRKETEGVFVVRDNVARFLPVKTGIAGDKYFEVLSGLKPGDQVITGPFNSVRDLQDGDAVKIDENNNAAAPART